MQDPQEEAVNQSVTATDTQLQETQGQEAQVAVEQENVQQDTLPPRGQEVSNDVDENGIPYKNKYMEVSRKLEEFADKLPRVIEETLAKKQQQQPPQEKSYTIEELEQIALQNPNLRPQVEAEKMNLQKREFAKLIEERERKQEEKAKADMVRNQTWYEVTSDPLLKDVFTQNAMGHKQFRLDHPMTQIIDGYMRNPEIGNRPDALKWATKLAYADYMRDFSEKTEKQARKMKATVNQEQRKTLVGGGVPSNVQQGDDMGKLRNEFIQSNGSRQATDNYLKAILKKQGLGI